MELVVALHGAFLHLDQNRINRDLHELHQLHYIVPFVMAVAGQLTQPSALF